MLKEESTDKKLILMSLRFSLVHLLTKLNLQLEILFFVRNVKHVLIFIAKLKSKNQLKEMNSKLGHVNSATQKMKLNLKRKKNLKVMRSIIFLKLLHRSKTRRYLDKRKSQWYSVLTCQDQCVSHSQLKAKFNSKVTKLRILPNLCLSVMVQISSCKEKEMLLTLAECNAFKQPLINN